MEDYEVQAETPQEPQDAPVSAEETTESGAQVTDSPAVDAEESGSDDTAQPQESEQQSKQARESRGVQKRIDELVRQREEANRRVDYLMGLVAQVANKPGQEAAQQAQQQPIEPQPPKESDFTDYESYLDAKADFKAAKAAAVAEKKVLAQVEATLNRERQARDQERASVAAQSWVKAGSDRYGDFAETVLDDSVRISPHMRDAILTDPAGHEVAYWLGKNPDAAAKISALPPLRQAQEIGRIAARVESRQQSTQTPQSKTTSAPPPIRPSGSKATVSKDPSKMSMSEYVAFRAASKR